MSLGVRTRPRYNKSINSPLHTSKYLTGKKNECFSKLELIILAPGWLGSCQKREQRQFSNL